MSSKTGIEWCDSTWNPIRGCTPVSPGCKNCYAAKVAKRFSFAGGPYEGLVRINAAGKRTDDWNGNIKFVDAHLLDPLKWRDVREEIDLGEGVHRYERRPRRIFVNSMSDLFHDGVTDEMRDRIFAVMALCPQHVFQVLTKRPERMREYMTAACTEEGGLRIGKAAAGLFHGMSLRDRHLSMAEQAAVSNQFEWKELHHVWLGVSVENQAAAERLDLLCEIACDGWRTMISCEPLLGPLDIAGWLPFLNDKTWVIVGGESGRGARPMLSTWAGDLQQQCETAGVPFFFKQRGEWVDAGDDVFGKLPKGRLMHLRSDGTVWPDPVPQDESADVHTVKRVGKKRAGHTLYGREWKQFPGERA